jgi:RNA polymerase sigma-70 factor (ECF subfamily)
MGLSRDESVPMTAPQAEESVRPDLERLFDEHADFIHRAVANLAGPSLDAEDLVQDVFVNACRGWSGFQGRSAVRTWLYGIALGVVANARRRARFRRFVGLDTADEPTAHQSSAPEDLEREQARRAVHALIDKLPEKKRTALVLFDLEGMSGEEIAGLTGVPLPTFWSRLHHARRELAEHVKRAEQLERARVGGRNE